MTRLIEVRALEKHYRIDQEGDQVVRALDGVDLTIDRGEFIAIVGPSGSGKSTLLQILGLLDKPSGGQYFFLGQDIRTFDDDALTRLRSRSIGFIFQLFNLLPRTSVLDNVSLPMIYRGVEIDLDRTQSILEKLGLSRHLAHTAAQLSGGQQQRVAIARALVNRPQIIFADEPTGNLPQRQAEEIISELRNLNKQGITVVIITHDDTIANRADRIIRIVDGKIHSDRRIHDTQPASFEHALENAGPSGVSRKLWVETVRIALNTLARNKFRTFLTMLGIIIGVLSVVSMLAIGEGAKKYMEYSLRKMGSNMFHVQTERPYSTNATKNKVKYSRLTVEDLMVVESLRSDTGMIKNVSPVIQDRVSVSYLGNSLDTRIEGVGIDYEEMRGNTPILGRFFTADENDRLEKVCLIGQSVYRELFPNAGSPVGSLVEISGRKFTVIGLLPAKGASWGGDSDDVVLVPYKTAMKRLTGAKYFTNIFVQSVDEATLDPTMDLVSSALRKSHRIPESAPNDFKIKNYSEIRETIESATQTMANFIGIVALISLVVGGIGIMNIMLVSVTERTREIGIRKAIGARSRDILFQFLVESCLIGAFGGLFGILLAFLLGIWMEYWMGWDVEFRFYSVAMSFGFAMLVGIGFGLYPANKAAKLSPINALRYE